MLASSSHGFMFVAVPKTASRSIENRLQQYDDKEISEPFNKHVLALKLNNDLGVEYLSKFFKFAFVRNPYTWMYSWYKFRTRDLLKDESHPLHSRYTGKISFEEFVQTFFEKEMFLKQSDFICSHAGELLVDYVGRYENLTSDYKDVCKRLNIPVQELDSLNVSEGPEFALDILSESGRKIMNNCCGLLKVDTLYRL